MIAGTDGRFSARNRPCKAAQKIPFGQVRGIAENIDVRESAAGLHGGKKIAVFLAAFFRASGNDMLYLRMFGPEHANQFAGRVIFRGRYQNGNKIRIVLVKQAFQGPVHILPLPGHGYYQGHLWPAFRRLAFGLLPVPRGFLTEFAACPAQNEKHGALEKTDKEHCIRH